MQRQQRETESACDRLLDHADVERRPAVEPRDHALLDGADLGVAMLNPFVAKRDVERRVLFNAIGPVWEGNQIWFILGGGAVFAAWPLLYAVSFSGFYLAMLLVLLSLIRICSLMSRR